MRTTTTVLGLGLVLAVGTAFTGCKGYRIHMETSKNPQGIIATPTFQISEDL